ncbi:MAG TPA: cytochrome c [Verrucomicrobiae bacterium]|nr:cytochrome c [Verrucomicrobiae bacterium]
MSSPANQPAANAPAENAETQSPAVPVWLIIVLFLLLYWGAVYFDEHGGWFEPQVYTPYASAEQVKAFQVSGGPNPFDDGFKIYNRPTCSQCHQPNGLGQPGQFPPLAGSDLVNEKDPGRVIRIVLQGIQGPGLVINGKPFNTGSAMVPWASVLNDEEIANVLTYVRGNKEWGNNAPAVTPDQVHAIRAKVAAHPLPFSPDEIMQISPSD